MVRRYFVATRLLQSGMKIDQSIVDGTKRVLIARGAILDDYLIDALRKLGISGVYIREGKKRKIWLLRRMIRLHLQHWKKLKS